MKKMKIEMPAVKSCDVQGCGFNNGKQCHAKAITIGDGSNPGCDTFFETGAHTKDTTRIAGVGACKVSDCIYNEDFECSADNIIVGFVEGKVNCRTFRPR